MPNAIGIDVGGTRIKAGVVDADGRVRARRIIDSVAHRGPDAMLADITDLARALADESNDDPPVGIGVGLPGAVDHAAGIVRNPPNLPGWREMHVAARLRKATGLPTFIDNDANVAALGEQRGGAGRGIANMVMLTLGTGVGGGIILDGRLLRGAFGTAGELGHTIIVPGGRQCGCGQHGCLEAYASASNIARQVAEAIQAGEASSCGDVLAARGTLDAEDVARAATKGDVVSARVWDEACERLAVACVNIQHTLNPRRIVLAGGLTAAGQQLLGPIRRHFSALTWRDVKDQPDIVLGELGDDAGVIGAASLAFSQ